LVPSYTSLASPASFEVAIRLSRRYELGIHGYDLVIGGPRVSETRTGMEAFEASCKNGLTIIVSSASCDQRSSCCIVKRQSTCRCLVMCFQVNICIHEKAPLSSMPLIPGDMIHRSTNRTAHAFTLSASVSSFHISIST